MDKSIHPSGGIDWKYQSDGIDWFHHHIAIIILFHIAHICVVMLELQLLHFYRVTIPTADWNWEFSHCLGQRYIVVNAHRIETGSHDSESDTPSQAEPMVTLALRPLRLANSLSRGQGQTNSSISPGTRQSKSWPITSTWANSLSQVRDKVWDQIASAYILLDSRDLSRRPTT
jgi:hypothetical protein